MAKSIEEKYKKLSEVEHVLARPGRYVGSITPHSEETFVYDEDTQKMVKRQITYNPAFIKLFDEVISNSVDHSKRPEGKDLDTIRVEVDPVKGSITVYDNGGIPVLKHKDYDQWIPEMIFELRAGSNFDDSDQAELTGQNGEGAALTNIFSTSFIVETCDGKKKFKMVFEDNSQTRKKPKITEAEGAKGFTKITYIPEMSRFNCQFDADNVAMLLTRTAQIAGLNQHLKVYWNGNRINIRSFKDFVALFIPEDGEVVVDDTEKWKVAVATSDNGFQHVSFVNGTHTKIGGTHINYVANQICEKLREFFRKKHKVEVKPAEIKNHLTLFIDASMVNPRYSSQTKEDLITEPRDYKTSWEVNDKMIRKITGSGVIQAVLDWVEAKRMADEMRELRKLNKDATKGNPKRVDKFDDAIERNEREKCMLFLTEGDSAAKPLLAARGKNRHVGFFAMRGKPLNVYDSQAKDVITNNEIANILTITGLQLGEEVKSLSELRFGKMVACSDADLDGFHISSLLISLFAKFWPELFKMGAIYRLETPVYVARTSKGDLFEFFSIQDYEKWAKTGPKHKAEYHKGLGGFEIEDFERFLTNEKYLVKIDELEAKDLAKLELAFSEEKANDRKTWLQDVRYFDIED